MPGYEQEGYTDTTEINWDDEGIPVSAGDYDLKLVDGAYADSTWEKHKKHGMSVQYEITKAYAPENERFIGKKIFDNWLFHGGQAFKVKEFLNASGLQGPTIINKPLLEEWFGTVKDTDITASVKHEVFNDQTRAKVGKVYAFGSLEEEVPQEEALGEETPAESSEPEAPKTNGKAAPAAQVPTQGLRQAAANGSLKKTNGAPAAAPGAKRPATKMAPKSKR